MTGVQLVPDRAQRRRHVPSGRDPAVDAVRALAIVGVVGGHWLVTGLVASGDGGWRQASPLAAMPALAPVSWLLQTLGLFFFAGGFAATRSLTRAGRRSVLSGAVRPLLRPLAMLVGGWAVVLGVAVAAGVPVTTLRTVATLVLSPLWFLLPFLALRAAAAPLAAAVDRAGAAVLVVPAIGVVAASDLGHVPYWLAVPAAWSVPWVLGIAVARGRLRAGLPLLLAGATALAALICLAGYPVSAVGVPGDGRSNLSPPSLAAIALAVAQIGIFLLLRRAFGRAGRTRLVGSLNRAALPIYLGHQSVLIAVTAGVSAVLAIPAYGLLTAPADPAWIAHRVAWLPFLALVLVAVIRLRWRATRRARADQVLLKRYDPRRFWCPTTYGGDRCAR